VVSTTGLVLVLTEDGYLVLVQPDPTGYAEVARYRALDGSSSSIPGLPVKCWNVPAISNGRIYVRSTTEAVCLEVSPAGLAPLRLSGAWSRGGQAFRLFIATADDSPLDSNRAANVEVFGSSDLALGPSGWFKLTNPVVLTNGQLFLDDLQSQTLRQRFFRAQEHP